MSICGGCPYPYEMMLAGNVKTEEEACGDGCLFEDAAYRTQLAYELLEKRYDKHIEEVKKLIPKEIWDEVSKEFAESDNAELWTMCLVAIEKLSDAYNKNYNWKEPALTINKKIADVLNPLFEETLKADFTMEDFSYLVFNATEDIILKYCLDHKFKNE